MERWGSKGVKLYTAEWKEDSRGWTLKDREAYRYLEKCQELGIKNIHVHKGPTIWPLDKDAFDVADVDHAATDFPELNFIVEHVGLPRIEDFCFMATQEPNVYAGCSVVIGGLMHARPRFFAKVMGELLFWVGEDKMTFGSDYGIWEPKWQVEGFVDWDYPTEEYSDYPRGDRRDQEEDPRAQRRQAVRHRGPGGVPARCRRRHPGCPGRRRACRRQGRGQRVTDAAQLLAALDEVRDPELDEPVTDLGFVASCTVSADGVADVHLRLPTYFCAPNFAFLMVADAYDAVSRVDGVRRTEVVLEDHFASDTINGGVAARSGFVQSFDGEAVEELDGLRADFLRKAVLAGTDRVCRPLLAAGHDSDDLARLRLGDVPPSTDLDRLRSRRAELGLPAGDDSPLLVDVTTGEAVAAGALPLHLRKARLTRVGVDANTGICRGMLRERYGTTGHGRSTEKEDA